MPVLDGYKSSQAIRDLVREQGVLVGRPVRESNEMLKIVAITGHVEEEYVKKARNHGIDEVLAKPVDLMTLSKILHSIGLIDMIPNNVRSVLPY